MNRFLLATVSSLAVAIATQAGAADLPMKARAPAMVDAPWSWTGFYIGAHVGAGWGTKEWNDPTASSLFSDAQGTVNGVLGGVQAGFNYQFAPHWLVGIEGDFSGADVKGTYPCFVSNGPDTCTSKSTWFATLTGRVGATVDHALVYVKGGAAWTHDDYTDSFISDGTEIWRASHTRLGYVLGTGIEYAIDRNWSAKVEYNYMDFGTKRADFVSNRGNTYSEDITQRIHTIKFGVNYRFDLAGPVVARY